MATVVNAFALSGVNAYPVAVETVLLHGQPSISIVGLGDTDCNQLSTERGKKEWFPF